MQTFYIIGEIKPLTQIDIQNIESLTPFSFPADYSKFLTNYGFGNINELLMITQPDEEYVKSNFGEYMDLWELTESETQSILNGLTIATTIDGDIVVLVDNKDKPIIMLPRHSNDPIYFDSFEKVIGYYNSEYNFKDVLYFDTYYNFELEYISFIRNDKLDKGLFEQVFQTFLKTVSFDKTYNIETQPKYVIQKMGGWAYFDNIGKNAIRIKYQKQFKSEADKIIKFVNTQIDQYGD